MLRNGILLKIGSPKALKNMTVEELETLVRETLKMDDRIGLQYSKDIVSEAFADYKRTLDTII